MTRAARICAAALSIAIGLVSSAAAQPAQAGRIEVAVGAGWTGRTAFGTQDASETTSTAGTFRLFGASTELAGAPDVEATGSYAKPELRTTIQNDSELTPPPAALTSPVSQFTAGGAVVLYPGWSVGSRGRAFVEGGAAYLRQLENDGALIVTGLSMDAGGGVKWLLASRGGRLKGLGVRVDARAVVRRNGIAIDGGTHVSPSVSGAFFVRF
jgi:hypothetical protein